MRPHWNLFLLALTLAGALLVGSSGTATATDRGAVRLSGGTSTPALAAYGGMERQVIRIVNRKRVAHGCRKVGERLTLRKAARRHSARMAAAQNLSHQLPGEPSLGVRVTNAGYHWSMVGENIAFGQTTARSVMRAWMRSPSHKANILNCRFRHLGVGVAFDGSYYWWTQDFGRPD